jgi:hypothetical protein
LPPSLYPAVQRASGLELVAGTHCAVVVSQDCDVTHRDYSVEPFVEILRGTETRARDGSVSHAKSARRLHIELETDEGPKTFEFLARDRSVIDRRLLEGASPHDGLRLPSDQRRILIGWLVKRFRRASFPDAFVNRLGADKKDQKLERLFKEYGHEISGVYVLLDPDREVERGEDYRATIWITVPTESYEDGSKLVRLETEFLPSFHGLIDGLKGIRLAGAMLVPESAFTLDDIRNTRRMDLDYLSFRSEGAHAPSEN